MWVVAHAAVCQNQADGKARFTVLIIKTYVSPLPVTVQHRRVVIDEY